MLVTPYGADGNAVKHYRHRRTRGIAYLTDAAKVSAAMPTWFELYASGVWTLEKAEAHADAMIAWACRPPETTAA